MAKSTSSRRRTSCSVRSQTSVLHSWDTHRATTVIGTLDAADYALFVSHSHPDGQVNFSVFGAARSGQTWGKFSTSADTTAAGAGPVYHEEGPGSLSASKVSVAKRPGDAWDTVLLARLRFAPDRDEPTSL